MREIFEVAGAILVSLGGGAAILLGLSSWLGKVWINRLLEAEKARHAEQLERLRAEFLRRNEQSLIELRSKVDVLQEKHLTGHKEKVGIYRIAVNLLADLLGDIELTGLSGQAPPGMFDRYNRGWMKAYGYLAMFAPQEVMDAFDRLNDYLLSVLKGRQAPQVWAETRKLALDLINAVRRDIGFDATSIEYHGTL